MVSQSIRKFLYLLLIAPVEVSVPVFRQLLFGIFPAGRPSRKWTFRQALMVRLTRALVRMASTARLYPPITLQPGAEGTRFSLVLPSASSYYIGPLKDEDVIPLAIGGTWTPKCPDRARTSGPDELLVALHFHGGAYVLGDGRDKDIAFAADMFLNDSKFTHVFSPQYRLSKTSKERFPAALQDAVSCYLYLIKNLGIPANRIVLGGDSAGGNLALGLLRYLHGYGAQLDIPMPSSALLWSPWTDVTVGDDPDKIPYLPNFNSDYIDKKFVAWGTKAITGNGKISSSDPYLSPAPGHPFKCEVPLWVHTGGRELLFNDNKKFVESFKSAGTEIDWAVDDESPHDMPLMGRLLGFEAPSRLAAKAAGEFVRRHL